MHLVSCKKCGRKVSDQYSYCTVCQAPLDLETNESAGTRTLGQRLKESSTRSSGSLSSERKTRKSSISLVFFGELLLGLTIASLIEYLWLIPKGIVTQENRELAYWILVLPIQFVVFTTHTLVTGKEPKVGKTKYSISRNARLTVLGVLFAFLGFLLGGQSGVIIGILLALGISIAIQYSFKHPRSPKT